MYSPIHIIIYSSLGANLLVPTFIPSIPPIHLSIDLPLNPISIWSNYLSVNHIFRLFVPGMNFSPTPYNVHLSCYLQIVSLVGLCTWAYTVYHLSKAVWIGYSVYKVISLPRLSVDLYTGVRPHPLAHLSLEFDSQFLLSVCLSVCLCLSLTRSVCLYVFLPVSHCLFLSLTRSVCLYVFLSVCLSVSLSLSHSLCLSVCLSVSLSIFLSLTRSVCLYVFLFVSLSLSLSLCLSLSPPPSLSPGLSVKAFLYAHLLPGPPVSV